MEAKKNTIGPSLTRLRDVVGINQTEAALIIGTNNTYLSKVENGEVTVTSKWVGNAFAELGKAIAQKPKATL